MSSNRRSLAEWDAEIEAEFQRAVAATKRPRQLRQRQRLIGCPWGFLVEVWRRTHSRTAMLVAQYVYHRMKVCQDNPTVTLSGRELAELGINRREKGRTLAKLQAAGFIQVEAGLSLNSSVPVTLERRWRI